MIIQNTQPASNLHDPTGDGANALIGLAPSVLRKAADNALPTAVGSFKLSSFYKGDRSNLARRQFSGSAPLQLHDAVDGEAAVAISDIGLMSLAYIRSTGHNVVVPEYRRPNLLVPVTGTLSSSNGHMQFKRNSEPWVLFGRGKRETTVLSERIAPYQALVLSMPSNFLGDHLDRVEARGGMIWGDANSSDDLHLAKLTVALATQVSVSTDREMEMRLADAWKTVVLAQLNRCLDMCLGPRMRTHSTIARDLSSRHVKKAEKLIYEQPDKIDTLRDIALHVGVSERTLQAAFRKVRGATPMQVLAQTRLHHARRALIDPEGPDTVSAVCAMFGIEHHGRFSRLYKQTFGELPRTTLRLRRNK